MILVKENQIFYLLNAKPPGAGQAFVPIQSDTAVQAKLNRDSWGQPPGGCSGPSCYWCPEGLGTEHDPQNSHPDTGHNTPLQPQAFMQAPVFSFSSDSSFIFQMSLYRVCQWRLRIQYLYAHMLTIVVLRQR